MIALRAVSLLSVLLWLEAFALTVAALALPDFRLLPAGAVLFVLASLFSSRPFPGILLGLTGILLFLSKSDNLSSAADVPVSYAVAAIIVGILCAFLGILSGLKSDDSPARKSLGELAVFLHFPIAGLFMADPFLAVSTHRIAAWLLLGVFALIFADTLSKIVSRLYTPQRHWHTLPPYGAFFFYRCFGKKFQALFPPASSSQESLKLAEMWMWPSVRKSLPALAITGLLLTWLGATAVSSPALSPKW